MKRGVRVIGVDDSPFDDNTQDVLLVGVVCRGNFVEGVLSTYVEKDGSDATEKIYRMIERSRFRPQIRCVLLGSVTVAGFNVVDIKELSWLLSIPVIALCRKKPSIEEVTRALKNVEGGEEKLAIFKKAGGIYRHRAYMQVAGITFSEAKDLLKNYGVVPEPLRLAHIIASGVVRGESKGRM